MNKIISICSAKFRCIEKTSVKILQDPVGSSSPTKFFWHIFVKQIEKIQLSLIMASLDRSEEMVASPGAQF